MDPKSSMDLKVYFCFLKLFNRYLKRNVDTEASMNLRVYFLLLSQASDRYLRRNTDNKSSMDFVVYFMKPLIDI